MKKKLLLILMLVTPVFFVLAQNDSTIAQEEYVEGRLIKTLNIDNVEVSTSLRSVQRSDGKYYTFDISVINNSSSTKLMKVNAFKSYITIAGKKKDKVDELEILSNKEYQDKKRKRGNFRAILSAVGAGANAQDAGRKTSTTNTNVNSNTYGTSNTTGDIQFKDKYGLSTGSAGLNATTNSSSNTNTNVSSTTQAYDGAAAYAARQNEERKLKEMMEQQQKAKAKWNEMYLKSETLEPNESVTGLLNIKFKKGDLVDLFIYIGNIEFVFRWNPEDAEF